VVKVSVTFKITGVWA